MAISAELQKEGLYFHLILNAYWEELEFELSRREGDARWRRWIDTSLDSPLDIVPWQEAPAILGTTYRVSPRSVVMLFMAGDARPK